MGRCVTSINVTLAFDDESKICCGTGTRYANANSSLYDLAAVIVHHGTGAGSGHYTAFATNNQVRATQQTEG